MILHRVLDAILLESLQGLPAGRKHIITLKATFAGGMLRPLEPLDLAEGETVELLIAQPLLAHRKPSIPGNDYALHLQSAKTLDELFTIMESAPPLPDDYDLCQALNANRKATGERLLYPE